MFNKTISHFSLPQLNLFQPFEKLRVTKQQLLKGVAAATILGIGLYGAYRSLAPLTLAEKISRLSPEQLKQLDAFIAAFYAKQPPVKLCKGLNNKIENRFYPELPAVPLSGSYF